MYNFHVDRLETYAVGVLGWLVHNTYHLNSNKAVAHFVIYAINIGGNIYKVGKAHAGRLTAAGVPVRIAQQLYKLGKQFPDSIASHHILNDLGRVSTAKAKLFEIGRIYEKSLEVGKVLAGNAKSFKNF